MKALFSVFDVSHRGLLEMKTADPRSGSSFNVKVSVQSHLYIFYYTMLLPEQPVCIRPELSFLEQPLSVP